MYFTITEKNNNTGRITSVSALKRTSRGTFIESKKFKTERAAKTWITKRVNELAGTANENTWSYQIVEHNA